MTVLWQLVHLVHTQTAVEQNTVEPTIKRSKSSEVLSSEARSATVTCCLSPEEQQPEPSISDVKSIWQKRLSLKSNHKPASKQDTKNSQTSTKLSKETKPVTTESKHTATETKASPTPVGVTPVGKTNSKEKPTSADESQRKQIARKTPSPITGPTRTPPPFMNRTKTPPPTSVDTRTPPPTTGRTRTPPPTIGRTRTPPPTKGRDSPVNELAKLTPVKQQQVSPPAYKSSAKPPPGKATPRAKNVDPVVKKESKRSHSSPKLSRFLSGSKLRARSESPEPSPKQTKKSKDSKSAKRHPLQISRSLQNLNEEAAAEETPINVHDIVKKYDLQSSSQSSVKPVTSEKGSSKGKGSSKTKKSDDKKREKSKKDKDSTKESKGSFFSFLKGRKSYNVASASSKNQQQSSLTELSQQPIVQKRIDQLRQIGLMTDGAEDTDVVLVGVAPLMEESNDEEMISSESTAQTETETTNNPCPEASSEEVDGVNVHDNTRYKGEAPDSEGISPVPEDTVDGLVEGKSPEARDCSGAAERVKKLKEVFSVSPQQPFSRHLSLYHKRCVLVLATGSHGQWSTLVFVFAG